MSVVGELFGGALLGAAFGGLLDVVVEATQKTSDFKSNLKNIKLILNSILPIIKRTEKLNKELDQPNEEIAKLMEVINEGKKLVSKCSKVGLLKKKSYADKLDNLKDSLSAFLFVMQVQQTGDLKEILWHFRQLNGGYASVEGQYRGTSEFTVGLDKHLMELKMKLFNDGSSVIVLTSPGGCGKTTLANKLCSDKEVNGKLKGNIFFVTVSKTPDLKVIVRRLFHQCKKEPEFLNDEDAINQLGQLLSQRATNPILLVLDDVWSGSESLAKKFKFQLLDCKILVTSRSVFPRFGSQRRLEALKDEDAMTLFSSLCLPTRRKL